MPYFLALLQVNPSGIVHYFTAPVHVNPYGSTIVERTSKGVRLTENSGSMYLHAAYLASQV